MKHWRTYRGGSTAAGIILGLTAVLGGCGPRVSDRDIVAIGKSELRVLIASQERDPESRVLFLIDPRASRHYEAGHIPGARNMHLPQFPAGDERDPEIASYRNIVVYGDHPGDGFAKGMVKRLIALRYRGVRFYAGGIGEWARTEPVVRPEGEPAEEPGPR
jgi:rhodanese-related sulfurtransferase